MPICCQFCNHRAQLVIEFISCTIEMCTLYQCTSGCVAECQICNQKVAGSNLGRGYFAPRPTQPSIPPGLVNE